jgi:excisionase family DNA binding protein
MEMQSVKEPQVRERPIQLEKVMELTGYSRGYIYKLTHEKKIPFTKPNGGKLFFYESKILDFLARNGQAADYEVSEQADGILRNM